MTTVVSLLACLMMLSIVQYTRLIERRSYAAARTFAPAMICTIASELAFLTAGTMKALYVRNLEGTMLGAAATAALFVLLLYSMHVYSVNPVRTPE